MSKQINRREFIKCSSLVIGGLLVSTGFRFKQEELRFGWVTDIHYAEAPVKWGRYFKESLVKLTEAVDLFNKEKVDFTIETGDFKDQTKPPVEKETLEYLKKTEAVYAKYKGERYHVLGNHDLDSLSKQQFLSNVTNSGISKDKSYYFFDKMGYRFIVLDACYTSEGKDYDHNNFHWADTNISERQVVWLDEILNNTSKPTIVFVHQLLNGEGDMFVNNADEVRSILEKSGNVIAVFQGHEHKGGVKVINGILYYTLKAMVEGSGMHNNSYAIVSLKQNGEIVIDGYRRANDFTHISIKEKQLDAT